MPSLVGLGFRPPPWRQKNVEFLCLSVGLFVRHAFERYSTVLGRVELCFATDFKARRNARIASAVLATAVPSVCLSHAGIVSKRRAHSTVQFALSYSKMCLVLYKPKNILQGRPLYWGENIPSPQYLKGTAANVPIAPIWSRRL